MCTCKMILAGLAVCIWLGITSCPASAGEAPKVTVTLDFKKAYYAFDDKIDAAVFVKNDAGQSLLVNGDFLSRTYFMELLITDPSGRIVPARRGETRDPVRTHGMTALPFVYRDGKYVETAPCSSLTTARRKSSAADLRKHFDLALPGHYIAQAQLSLMVFKGGPGDPCDINNYEWVGVVKSTPQTFFYEGRTNVKISPRKWSKNWLNTSKEIKVTIWPGNEKPQVTGKDPIDLYEQDVVYLNKVPSNSVQKRFDPVRRIHYLEAVFDSRESILSLKKGPDGKPAAVLISGRLQGGAPYGGVRKIDLVDD